MQAGAGLALILAALSSVYVADYFARLQMRADLASSIVREVVNGLPEFARSAPVAVGFSQPVVNRLPRLCYGKLDLPPGGSYPVGGAIRIPSADLRGGPSRYCRDIRVSGVMNPSG